MSNINLSTKDTNPPEQCPCWDELNHTCMFERMEKIPQIVPEEFLEGLD